MRKSTFGTSKPRQSATKPIRNGGPPMFSRVLPRSGVEQAFRFFREEMERRKTERHIRALENLASSQRQAALSSIKPSGEILPGVDFVPIQDVAARWKVSPEQICQYANAGQFRIVVTKAQGIADHWYLDSALWPHGEKKTTMPAYRVVHTLVNPPLNLSATMTILFPIDEVRRIEAERNTKRFFNIKTAMEEAGKSEKTIRRAIKSGKLPAKKDGGSYLIAEDDLRSLFTCNKLM